MDSEAFKTLVIKFAAIVESFEERGEKSVHSIVQSANSIQQISRQAAQVSEQVTSQALQQFSNAAGHVVADAIHAPIANCEKRLQSSADNLHSATAKLEKQLESLRALHVGTAWKAFIASAIASLAVMVVAGYMVLTAVREVKRAEWVSNINTAVANGKLMACPGGGICAQIDKKLVRLDN